MCIDGRRGANRTVHPGELFQPRGRVRAGLGTSSAESWGPGHPPGAPSHSDDVRSTGSGDALGVRMAQRAIRTQARLARPQFSWRAKIERRTQMTRRTKRVRGKRRRTRASAHVQRPSESTRSAPTRHAHASGGPSNALSHSSGCECAREYLRCVARPRIRPRGSATTRVPGPKLVVLYPCALDRVRYTSEGRTREREC